MASPSQFGLDPCSPVSETDCVRLANKIGPKKWKDLARALGFNETEIDVIETEKGTFSKECPIAVLVGWHRRNGKDATYGKLAKALTSVGLKNLADSLLSVEQSDPNQSLKMSTRIKELEDESLKMSTRIKELEDEGLENALSLPENASDVSMDTDQGCREARMDKTLRNLKERLEKYVIAPLEVPEIKDDQLKTPIKLDLLSKISGNLQELYTDILRMVAEACKCSEDLKRDFYDFAYHGLRAEHNELLHRVDDLETKLPEMSEEEREDFERLKQFQNNRKRQVNALEKTWRALFRPPERLPKATRSDVAGSKENKEGPKKVWRHSHPGEVTNSEGPIAVTSKEDKCGSPLNVPIARSIKRIFKKDSRD